MRSRSKVPARVCLGGEDLDWMGGQTLLAAIDLYLDVAARPIDLPCIVIRSGWPFDMEVALCLASEEWDTGGPLNHVAAAIRRFQWEHRLERGLQLEVSTEFPPSSGLSSSAAVILATISSVAALLNVSMSTEALIRMAYETERDLLSTGCGGMDFEACGHGGIRVVDTRRRQTRSRETSASAINLVVMDTLQTRDTRTVIAQKRRRLADQEPGILRYRRRAANFVAEMIETIESPYSDVRQVGKLVSEIHETMRDDLDVSTDRIEAARELALAAGALGAKVSGTGLGGCVFALVSCQESGSRLAEHARNAGYPSYVTRTTPIGASTSVWP